jgi:hypothetical protein
MRTRRPSLNTPPLHTLPSPPGTLFNQIQQLLQNPQQILVILGTGVPQTASFFILCARGAPLLAAGVGRAGSRTAAGPGSRRKAAATGPWHAVPTLSTPQTTRPVTPPLPPDTLFVGLIGRSLSLLRIPGLIFYAITTSTARTARARARTWQLQTSAFGPRIPDNTIILLLGVVFSCIQ